MNALFLTMFVSFILFLGGMLLFGHLIKKRTWEHSDRLSLLPLEDDPVAPTSSLASPASPPSPSSISVSRS